jgi:hypothetical protein
MSRIGPMTASRALTMPFGKGANFVGVGIDVPILATALRKLAREYR